MAEQAWSDPLSVVTERPQKDIICCMQDSCNLDPVAKEICTNWSLFVSVAQRYMQPTSASRVGLFVPGHP